MMGSSHISPGLCVIIAAAAAAAADATASDSSNDSSRQRRCCRRILILRRGGWVRGSVATHSVRRQEIEQYCPAALFSSYRSAIRAVERSFGWWAGSIPIGTLRTSLSLTTN